MASKLVAALLGHTRRGEETSTVTVLKVEAEPKLGQIVRVAVDGIKVKTPTGVQTRLPHMPISATALAASVTKLVAHKVAIPDFAVGYEQWKSAHGGVFTIGAAECVAAVEQATSGAAR